MYMYECVQAHVCICRYTRELGTCKHMYLCTCMYVYIYIFMYINMYNVHVHEYVYASVNVHIHVCIHRTVLAPGEA